MERKKSETITSMTMHPFDGFDTRMPSPSAVEYASAFWLRSGPAIHDYLVHGGRSRGLSTLRMKIYEVDKRLVLETMEFDVEQEMPVKCHKTHTGITKPLLDLATAD